MSDGSNKAVTMRKVIPFSSQNRDEERPGRRAAPTQPVITLREGNIGTEEQLILLQRIAGSASVSALIQRFHAWADEVQLADSSSFARPGPGPETADMLIFGERRHHQASYDLTLDNTPLGLVTFSRRHRYNESELLGLEQALGSLARCLHTALELERLQRLVSEDSLTGLGNRSSLEQWIEREVSRAHRHSNPLAVMMIDVDHFKAINDQHGHLAGDRVLQHIASILRGSTRKSDLLFRFGGDEFTVLLPHTDQAGAEEAARQIRRNLADNPPAVDGDRTLTPDVSIGIACYGDGDDGERLMERADNHLYEAKHAGRACVCAKQQ